MVIRDLLSNLDSNQDRQSQNLTYYHYTIGQNEPVKLKFFGLKKSLKELSDYSI